MLVAAMAAIAGWTDKQMGKTKLHTNTALHELKKLESTVDKSEMGSSQPANTAQFNYIQR